MNGAIIYEKQFEPYTEDGHTLEATFKYLTNLATQKKISPEVVELSINEIFAEMANGRKFSKTKCSCGCGIDKAATDLIHAIRDRMFEIDKSRTTAVKDLMQKRYQLFLVEEMKRFSTFNKERDKLINGSWWYKFKEYLTMPVFNKIKKENWELNKTKAKLKRINKYLGK